MSQPVRTHADRVSETPRGVDSKGVPGKPRSGSAGSSPRGARIGRRPTAAQSHPVVGRATEVVAIARRTVGSTRGACRVGREADLLGGPREERGSAAGRPELNPTPSVLARALRAYERLVSVCLLTQFAAETELGGPSGLVTWSRTILRLLRIPDLGRQPLSSKFGAGQPYLAHLPLVGRR